VISSEGGSFCWFRLLLTIGAGSRVTFVVVLARTLGQDGAVVSALKRSNISAAVDLQLDAAFVTLQRVTEKPGPLRELSKTPEYILAGLIFHVESVIS
jgi:hypothetical protein